MAELLDGEGLLQGALLPDLRPLLACWSRCRAIGGKAAWDRESEKQFRLLVLEAIRLSRGDGTQVLSEGEAGRWTPKLFKLALQLVDRQPIAKTAARMLPGGKTRAASQGSIKLKSAVNSEWAEIAVLQPAWQRGGPKLTLAYAEQRTQIELEHRGKLIWSGTWDLEVRLDGTRAELASNWEEVCWMSDADADYVEIEAKLTGGITVQRHVLLARKDRCLLLGDAVLGPRRARIEYGSGLPLASSVEVEPAAETREVWLAGRRARLAALPLALPEWRVDPRRGELSARDGKLWLAAKRPDAQPHWLCAAHFRPRRQARSRGADLAAIDRRRDAAGADGGRGRRISGASRQVAVVALSFIGRARRADSARTKPFHGVLVRQVPPQWRGRPVCRDRVKGAMRDVDSRLSENLARLHERISAAAVASGRTAGAVTLVAATKYLSAELARRIVLAGCRDLGESRPQELWAKASALADLPVAWHFIGHLQRNKIRRTLPPISLLHSVDSQRLLAAVNDEAAALGQSLRALLEVNISGETNKHGFSPEELKRLFDGWPNYSHVRVCGLMGMAALAGGPAAAESDFARLRALRDQLTGALPGGLSLDELSMGMSGDFEAAIRAEGAPHPRPVSARLRPRDWRPDPEA